jgi:hypothetical protein
MDRRTFGAWGLELSDGDFACAVAAVGVLAAQPLGAAFAPAELLPLLTQADIEHRAVPWVWPSARLQGGVAAALAVAWRQAIATMAVRLEIAGYGHDANLPFLVDTLGNDDVGASVYARAETDDPYRAWHWPLRVGVPDGATLLRQAVADNRWNGTHFDVFAIEEETRPFDLLLLPFTARRAAKYVLALPRPARVGLVVLLDGLGSTWGRSRALLATVQTELRSAAIAVANIPPTEAQDWWLYVLEALSHDQTIDVALSGASRVRASPYQTKRIGVPPTLLLASAAFVTSTRLAAVALGLAERFERQRTTTLMTGPHAQRVGIYDAHADQIGRTLRTIAPDLSYRSEREGGSVLAELARGPLAIAEAEAPPEPDQRRVLADIYDVTTAPTRVDQLHPYTSYRIDVSIALSRPDASAVASSGFPSLPKTETGHDLVVVFTDPQLEPRGQSARMHLDSTGPAGPVSFFLRTQVERRNVEARIVILFGNRILQTLLLRASVSAIPTAVPFQLDVETVVRPFSADLDQRSHFDAAIVLNHTDGGTATATVIAGDTVGFDLSQGLIDGATRIRDELTRVATSNQPITSLREPRMEALLAFVAAHGAVMYESIGGIRLVNALKHAKRIHVLTARPEAYVPLELAYDRPAPNPGAKLCSGAESALENGACSDMCETLGPDAKSYVCPVGFLGLSRVIERHASDPLSSPAPELRLDWGNEPSPGRDALALAGSLFAASARVDDEVAGSSASVLAALNAVAPTKPVQTWTAWQEEISKRGPGLLVVLPHTLEDTTFKLPTLEIATSEDLLLSQIEIEHVRLDALGPGPVVLLLGCDTGVQPIPYESFVVRLRSRHASIVVSTISSVLGRHAAPTAVALIEALLRHRGDPTKTFGDVMLAVRRELLRKPIAMSLALSAYGDADWRLQ